MFGIAQRYISSSLRKVDGSSIYSGLASLYDALLGDRFFPKVQRTFERLVRRYAIRFTSAADVACGTGTFVRYLCERGVPIVYGLDRSPEMLRAAIAKNRGTIARFFRQDFAILQLPQPVDIITCHFDSLNYLLTTEDLLGVFRRFHANLNPSGCAVFDMITDRWPWKGQGPRVERATGEGVSLVRVTRWDRRRAIQTASVSISRDGHAQREVHVQRGYPVAVAGRLLAQSRFLLVGAHDFGTSGPVTRRTPRAVYVARADDG
jgi:SAM-dependent methyltransferase